MIKLSVIVPFFNVEQYAAENLRSLVANAAPGIEFVLVDDCSTDATSSILADAAEWLPGARLVRLREKLRTFGRPKCGPVVGPRTLSQLSRRRRCRGAVPFSALVDVIERLGCDFVRTDHIQVHRSAPAAAPHQPCAAWRSLPGTLGHRTGRAAQLCGRPHAWAGIYHRGLLDAGLLRFDEDLRTCEDRLWIWRLLRQASTFAVVGLHGVRYRRDVSASLTRLGDELQFYLVPAFERILRRVCADRDAASFLPKALRTYYAVVCHHLNQRDRYPAALQHKLRAEIIASLAQLPTEPLNTTIAELDAERAATVESLVQDAA